MTPLDRHGRGALQFSGGKDSLALVYLLRPQWDRLTLYHVDTGDLLPEVREIVDTVEAMVPDFRRIETDAKAWTGPSACRAILCRRPARRLVSPSAPAGSGSSIASSVAPPISWRRCIIG